MPFWEVTLDEDESVMALGVDVSGNVIVGGGTDHGFLRKYSAFGDLLWSRKLEEYMTPVRAVAVDGSGNVLTGGETPVTGEAGWGTTGGYVRKYDPDGNELWMVSFPTGETEGVNAVSVDPAGYPFVTGTTSIALPGQQRWGVQDAYLMRLAR